MSSGVSYNSDYYKHLIGQSDFEDDKWLSSILFTNNKDKFYLYRDNKILNKKEFKQLIDYTIDQYFGGDEKIAVIMSGDFNCDYIDITEQLNQGLAMSSS